MIELRWITRDSKLDVSEDHIPCYAPERVLQYRQQYDATIRAGMWVDERPPNLQWSDWKDVPEVVERDLSCP